MRRLLEGDVILHPSACRTPHPNLVQSRGSFRCLEFVLMLRIGRICGCRCIAFSDESEIDEYFI